MRQQDIKIGSRYETKVSGRTVEVECVGVRSVPRRTHGIETGTLTRWVVAPVVAGRVGSALPKARTAAALRPLPAPRRLAREVLREACAAQPIDLFTVARILRTMRLYTLSDLSRADATIAAILGFCAERNALELRSAIEHAVEVEARRLSALHVSPSRVQTARDAAESYYARDIAEHLTTNVRPTPEAVLAFTRLAPAWAIARLLEKLDREHRKLPAATRARMYGAP